MALLLATATLLLVRTFLVCAFPVAMALSALTERLPRAHTLSMLFAVPMAFALSTATLFLEHRVPFLVAVARAFALETPSLVSLPAMLLIETLPLHLPVIAPPFLQPMPSPLLVVTFLLPQLPSATLLVLL